MSSALNRLRQATHRSTAVVAVMGVALALVASAGPAAPVAASPATFISVASVGQIAVTGLTPGESVSLWRNDGVDHDVTSTLTLRTWYPSQQPGRVLIADAAGALVIREVAPGPGYTIHRGAQVSAPITVLGGTPDPARSTPADVTYQSTQLTTCGTAPVPGTQCFTYIPTRDGTLLSANITFPYSPMPPGGWPVLVDYSGYDPSQPGQTPSEAAMYPFQGYVVVGLNMRGTTCSGGAFDYFEALQSLDGYDAIEVLAHQPWTAHDIGSKAKIGMVGLSYMGISQLFVAQTQPPDLQAITPLSVIADTYRSTLRPGGIFNNGFARDWALQRVADSLPATDAGYSHAWVKNRLATDPVCAANQALRRQSVDLINKNDTSPFYLGMGGDELAPRSFVHNINVPTYLGGAWQDEQTGGEFSSMFKNFSPTLTANHQVRAFLTNGTHTESLAAQNLTELMGFIDFYVGKKTPALNGLFPAVVPGVLQGIFGGSPIQLQPNRWVGPNWDGGIEGPCANPVANPVSPAATPACRYADALLTYQSENPVRVVWENGAGTAATTDASATIAGSPVGTAVSTFGTWPPSQVTSRRYYLQPDGKLSLTAPMVGDAEARGISRYIYDPTTKRASSFDGSTSDIWRAETQTLPDSSPGGIHWKPLAEGNSLSFQTDPFSNNTAMAGQGSVDLWMRSNAADADLEVTITEIRPDGTERYVQSGWLRASHRTLDPARSTELVPFLTQLQSDASSTPPLNAGQFQPMRVGLFPFAHVFRTGSRLRLNIEAPGGNQPFWKYDTCTLGHVVAGCATAAGPGPQVNEVAHSLGRPSSVVLPVLPDSMVPAVPASTPCPSVRNEPCRPYLPARVATGVSATVDSMSVAHVTWTAPASGGVPTAYRVTAAPGGQAVDVAGTATTATIPVINRGVPVAFTVQAIFGTTVAPAGDASMSVIDSGTRLTPVVPTRILDTRPGSGHHVLATLGPGGSGDLSLSGGTAPIPNDAEAVVLNVTVTRPTASGFLTAYPTGEARPNSSNLNFVPGQTVANLVTVKVGASRSVTLFNSYGSTDVVVDIVGFYSPSLAGATYTAQVPRRLLDTRPGAGHVGFTTLAGAHTGNLVVRGGSTGVPADSVAVVLNLTVTDPTGAGFVTAYPTAVAPNPVPLASSVNFVPGQTVANLVTVQIGMGDSITVFNSFGSTDLVAEVVGYFRPGDVTGGAFHPMSPTRVLDTRAGSGHQAFPTLGPGQHQDLVVAGLAGVPVGATRISGNLTATAPTASGYLTIYPSAAPPNDPPLASNLHFSPGMTVPGLVSSQIGLDGKVSIFNSFGSTEVVFDVSGWYG